MGAEEMLELGNVNLYKWYLESINQFDASSMKT